jgi:hypothetical protein
MARLRWMVPVVIFGAAFVAGGVVALMGSGSRSSDLPITQPEEIARPLWTAQGRPLLDPIPEAAEVWDCEVAVVGGSLGGIAAAHQAMRSGATTCLIELTPWLGGQISSQGVSAIDESLPMRRRDSFAPNWVAFKTLLKAQMQELPAWTGRRDPIQVADSNRCWVGGLCFLPTTGARVAQLWLEQALPDAPQSRWQTSVAFKGAEFDPTGREITAIYGVRRIPLDPSYQPMGHLSREFGRWYSWSSDEVFEKIPLRIQAPAGRSLLVIDATDTGELVAWAGIPYRVGTESAATTGEIHPAEQDNPECTQAFTFPFVLGIHDDQGSSRARIAQLQTGLTRAEHRREYDLEGFPMFAGQSVFNYRRAISLSGSDPFYGTPALGDMTLINWNRGNDWGIMNPALLMTPDQIRVTGQHHNWQGGMHFNALKDGENHALLFAEWLMETQSQPGFPLALLDGPASPMGTLSGLSMYPYIREGRRILGRAAYGESELMMREQDIRVGPWEARNFSATAIAITHYAIDMHGCRYRNWEPSFSASSAPINEYAVRPILIPMEALIPQEIDNLLIGNKGIAVTHIVNAATRVHHGEWSIGAAAGGIAGWLATQPGDPLPGQMSDAQKQAARQHLQSLGLRWDW